VREREGGGRVQEAEVKEAWGIKGRGRRRRAGSRDRVEGSRGVNGAKGVERAHLHGCSRNAAACGERDCHGSRLSLSDGPKTGGLRSSNGEGLGGGAVEGRQGVRGSKNKRISHDLPGPRRAGVLA
jgi:hypothetical protein